MRTIRLHLTIPGEGQDTVSRTLAGLDPVELATVGRPVTMSENSWTCVDLAGGTAVTFAARLDLKAASLVGESETAAVQAIVDDALRLATTLFDGHLRVDDVVIQGQPAAALFVA